MQLQRATPLYQQIYHLLRQQILQGHYEPGENLLESRIAQALSVSRTPVREALRQLEREGLVIAHDSELVVANPTNEEFLELYLCRSALERVVAERSARLSTPADIAEMSAALDEAEQRIQQEDHAGVIAANTRFHDAMVASARMSCLRLLMDTIRGPILVARRKVLADSTAMERVVYQEHRVLLNAISEHDVEGAQAQMDLHMRHDMERGTANFA